MNILVTGANGFIGSALVSRLIEDPRYRVRAAVRRTGIHVPRCASLFLTGDLAADTDWRAAVTGVDVLVHAAARVHVMQDKATDPLAEYRRTNVDGTLNLATQAAIAGVRRFIFISSIKVNGEGKPGGGRYSWSDPPAPLDPYGVSKLEAENGLRELAGRMGMEVFVVRPALVYGPQVKGNFLRLLAAVARGIPLPFANTDNRRSLLNLTNLVDFVVRCIEHPTEIREPLLISDGEDVSTGELVRRLATAMNRKPRLFPVPQKPSRWMLRAVGRDEVWGRLFGSLRIDCGPAQVRLGWTPPTSVAAGLAEVGQWYTRSKGLR